VRALELLAPAKNLECGIAAIDHGADAVYIGASRFGARAAAGNSVEDIRALCEYAHPFGVKVYVTVNTILYDEELEDTRRLLAELRKAEVDAILVQDMGVVEIINEELKINNYDYLRLCYKEKKTSSSRKLKISLIE
jgi:putative protease